MDTIEAGRFLEAVVLVVAPLPEAVAIAALVVVGLFAFLRGVIGGG